MQAERLLKSAYNRLNGSRRDGIITFRSWTPAGVRTKNVRRFTMLAVNGKPLLVSKTPLDHDDRKVAAEWDKLSILPFPAWPYYPRGVEASADGFIMPYAPGDDFPNVLMPSVNRKAFARLLNRVVVVVCEMHLHGHVADRAGSEARWLAVRQYIDEPYVDGREYRRTRTGRRPARRSAAEGGA